MCPSILFCPASQGSIKQLALHAPNSEDVCDTKACLTVGKGER